MKKFFSKINTILLGGVTVAVGLLFSFLLWCYGPQDTVPMWILCLTLIVCYAVCIVIYAVTSKETRVIYVLPEVKAIRISAGKEVFLVEKNDLFTQGAYVTIAYQDEDDAIETTLGLGYIETVNSLGNMQVIFIKKSNDPQAQEIISRLEDKKHCRKSVKIKPTVQKSSVEEDLMTWEEF